MRWSIDIFDSLSRLTGCCCTLPRVSACQSRADSFLSSHHVVPLLLVNGGAGLDRIHSHFIIVILLLFFFATTLTSTSDLFVFDTSVKHSPAGLASFTFSDRCGHCTGAHPSTNSSRSALFTRLSDLFRPTTQPPASSTGGEPILLIARSRTSSNYGHLWQEKVRQGQRQG